MTLAGADDSLARIVRVEPRTLGAAAHRRRHRPGRAGHRRQRRPARGRHVASPTRSRGPGLIDRCLVAAYDAGLTPLLVLTKADLASPDELLATYAPLDVPHVAAAPRQPTWPRWLRAAARTAGRVLVGHSGVGKSTLVNALVPGADRAIGAVNTVTGRGRHTSTSAVALELPGRRLGDRHPGDPVVRAGPRRPVPGGRRVPRPGRRHRRLPAALHPRRARVRARRLGRGGPRRRRPGSTRCAACCGPASCPTPTTDAATERSSRRRTARRDCGRPVDGPGCRRRRSARSSVVAPMAGHHGEDAEQPERTGARASLPVAT